jgi:fumarate hydratase class II
VRSGCPPTKLWGAQTQRSLEHFSIGKDLIPREMIAAYAVLKKAAANANHAGGRLTDEQHRLIDQVCDEILAGEHQDMFPLHVWMAGSGTQFNMNVNEVVSNRCRHVEPARGVSPFVGRVVICPACQQWEVCLPSGILCLGTSQQSRSRSRS